MVVDAKLKSFYCFTDSQILRLNRACAKKGVVTRCSISGTLKQGMEDKSVPPCIYFDASYGCYCRLTTLAKAEGNSNVIFAISQTDENGLEFCP